jgi:phosphoglucosamine mutase
MKECFMTQRKLFGTDGIRGKANKYPMTGEIAMALGRAVTSYFQKKTSKNRPLIIIGKDTRRSCYMLEQAFGAGVMSQGGRGIFTGPLPTPGVAFVTDSMRADAGVMISASHNSFEDNGIKIFDRNGRKLPDEVELELEKIVLNQNLLEPKFAEELGKAERLDEVIGRYIVHAKNTLDHNVSLEGKRLIVDCANGAGYRVAPMIFQELGAEVMAIGVAPNGININHECGATSPSFCAESVVKYRADLGICLDGDADRLIVVDKRGNVVNGDQLIGVLAKFLFESGQMKSNEVVGTIMSNMGVEKYLESHKMNLFRTKVGDRYIIERMKESGAVFGGEPSGHLIFTDYATTGDGIVAALKVIEAMQYYNKELHELVKEVPLYPQGLRNVSVNKKVPFEQIPEVSKALVDAEQNLKGKGRVVLRYSGTEDLARVMIEAQSDDLVEKYLDELCDVVRTSLS